MDLLCMAHEYHNIESSRLPMSLGNGKCRLGLGSHGAQMRAPSSEEGGFSPVPRLPHSCCFGGPKNHGRTATEQRLAHHPLVNRPWLSVPLSPTGSRS